MKEAIYSDQKIISAGKSLVDAGKNVTAFAIRKIIKGGNAQRIRDVWAKHLLGEVENVNVSEFELPREMLEVVEQSKITINEIAIQAYRQAKNICESDVKNTLKSMADTKEQSNAEISDATIAVEESEAIAEKLKEKNAELEISLRSLSLKKAELLGELKSELGIRKKAEKQEEMLMKKLDIVSKERDEANGRSDILTKEVKSLQKQLNTSIMNTEKYGEETAAMRRMIESLNLHDGDVVGLPIKCHK